MDELASIVKLISSGKILNKTLRGRGVRKYCTELGAVLDLATVGTEL